MARHRSPELGFLLLSGGWCILFFSLSGCKLPTYVLPAFPPLALALGYYLASSRWARNGITLPVAGVMAALLAVAHYVVLPWYARHHSPMRDAQAVWEYCGDPRTPVICYPRPCDSVSFYLGRDDLRNYRSKETLDLIRYLLTQQRVVILFTHRHSLSSLRETLPRELRLTGETVLFGSAKPGPEGNCYMAIVERRLPGA
jgi:hypothetical protein